MSMKTLTSSFSGGECRNPSLGLVTKAKGLQGCGQRLSPGVAFSCPESAKECEGMNLHTPKWTAMLGVGVSQP